jgi:hypothetical protein
MDAYRHGDTIVIRLHVRPSDAQRQIAHVAIMQHHNYLVNIIADFMCCTEQRSGRLENCRERSRPLARLIPNKPNGRTAGSKRNMKPEALELDREPPTTTHPDSSDVVTVAAPMYEINLLKHANRLGHPSRRDSSSVSVEVTAGIAQLEVGRR